MEAVSSAAELKLRHTKLEEDAQQKVRKQIQTDPGREFQLKISRRV